LRVRGAGLMSEALSLITGAFGLLPTSRTRKGPLRAQNDQHAIKTEDSAVRGAEDALSAYPGG